MDSTTFFHSCKFHYYCIFFCVNCYCKYNHTWYLEYPIGELPESRFRKSAFDYYKFFFFDFFFEKKLINQVIASRHMSVDPRRVLIQVHKKQVIILNFFLRNKQASQAPFRLPPSLWHQRRLTIEAKGETSLSLKFPPWFSDQKTSGRSW